MFALTASSTETGSQALSRSSSAASSVASGTTTHSFLPEIEHEDLFSASFVLGAIAESPTLSPRAPYLRPISTFASPNLAAASSPSATPNLASATLTPSHAGMRSTDTLVSVARQPSIASSLSMATQPAAPTKDGYTLPPTRPLVISHQKRSLRQRLSLSRATPAPPPQAELERTKRAFSLPFNLPSHSTVSLVPSIASTTSELPNLLPEADVREVAEEETEDASWIPPPPPIAKGQSEAPVKGKGGPGWYGGKRINERGEVVQVAADGTETVIMKLPQRAPPVHAPSVASIRSTPTLPSVVEQGGASSRPASRKLSASSIGSHSSNASDTSSLFDSYSEGASSRSSFSSAKSSTDDHHIKAEGSARADRPHRHRRSKILSTLKAQHSAEKLALSNALDESRDKVEALTRDNTKLQDECRELRALVLDIRRVIQADAFVGLGVSSPPSTALATSVPTKDEVSSALLPPALIRSSRSSTSSVSSEEACEQQDEQDATFGGGVGREWFDEAGSSDEEEDEDPTVVRDLIAAFPPSPTSLPASPPPTAPLPTAPNFGFRSAKSTNGHKTSASMSSFSRIPMMPRHKRADSAPKLVIGAPQDFRTI